MSNEYWDKLIKSYIEQPKEYPMEYADWIEPYSEQLAKVSKQGEIVNKPIADEVINQIELKLKVKLPPSYLEFLKYSNGLLLPDRFTNLLPLENVDWFYTLNKEWADSWNESAVGYEETSDEEYFVYGEEQDTCNMRDRYLNTALQISDSLEGEVLLLNPEVKFGNEWEAWYFANYLPGAIRFKSFKALLEYLITPSDADKEEPLSDEEYAELVKKDKEGLKDIVNNALDSILLGMASKGLNDKEIVKEFEKELDLIQKEISDQLKKDL